MSPLVMDRRQFLAGALATGALGAMHHGLGSSLSRSLGRTITPGATSSPSGRTLVLLTLYGGNDGLSTVVPYSDPAYLQQRGVVAIPESSVLQIGQGFGLHPSLTGIKALWDAGQVAVIRGVGYPNPSYSHFESMDIWQSGDPSGDVQTGWIGRWLDTIRPDPLQALWIGANLPLAFVGKNQQASSIAASSSPAQQIPSGDAELRNFYALLQQAHRYDTKLQRASIRAGTDMLTVSRIISETIAHAPAVAQNFDATAGSFGTELGVVAQLIAAGMPTQVYGVSLNGFDSHAGELASYATLLKQLDSGVAGFFKSLQGVPQGAQTVLVIYTEFGRRVAANASEGTDHGSGNTAFVIGPSVKGAFYGEQPSLTQLDSNGSLVVSTDYRAIYATVLEQILDVDPTVILRGQFTGVPFI